MPDRDSVINDLNVAKLILCNPQMLTPEMCIRIGQAITSALALLKEQEAVTIKKTKEHGFGVYGGICPKCRNWIQSAHSFCGFCGQAVKWE